MPASHVGWRELAGNGSSVQGLLAAPRPRPTDTEVGLQQRRVTLGLGVLLLRRSQRERRAGRGGGVGGPSAPAPAPAVSIEPRGRAMGAAAAPHIPENGKLVLFFRYTWPTAFFPPPVTYVWDDDDGIWKCEEKKTWLVTNIDGVEKWLQSFPKQAT